jgi:hypothetical protein
MIFSSSLNPPLPRRPQRAKRLKDEQEIWLLHRHDAHPPGSVSAISLSSLHKNWFNYVHTTHGHATVCLPAVYMPGMAPQPPDTAQGTTGRSRNQLDTKR